MPLLPKKLFAAGAFFEGTRFSQSAFEIIPFPRFRSPKIIRGN